MWTHLKNRHKKVYDYLRPEVKGDQQAKITEFAVKEKYPQGSLKKKTIDRKIIELIIGGLHPFQIVDEPEFVKLLEILDPRYKVPSRQTVRKNVAN